MKKTNLNVGQLVTRLYSARVGLFLLATIVVFGFVGWQVWRAINIAPSQSSGAVTASPKIDQATVDKIRSLQDSSVQVRSLFDEARRNPFQE